MPAGTKAIRVRYCFESGPAYPNGNTVDIGVFSPGVGALPGVGQRRGWSGSAVRDLAISENGFSPASTYNSNRKAYVSGFTTRAYQPGPIPTGTWNVELGMAALEAADPNGIYVHVIVETSKDALTWANDPYVRTAYSGASQNSAAGWYTGDLHVHGEQEPGNTPVADSLDYAFKTLAQGGAGLDFVTLIDHNNDVGLQGEVGKVQGAHPGHLVIPGTEVTTYNGHFNNQAEHQFADYRTGPVYRFAGTGLPLISLRGATTPAAALAGASNSGGWSQINHPTTLPEETYGPFCRGCAWDFSNAATSFGGVDAIEVQNTPTQVFTPSAVAFYQRALATGAHVAAVGSSDYHRVATSPTDNQPLIGGEETVVYASSLSEDAITAAVKADHTYVKFFGANSPDIRFTADVAPATTDVVVPGRHDAIIGDSLNGPAADLNVEVLGAGPTAPSPGPYELQLIRDGVTIETTTVSGDDFNHALQVTETGRYQVAITRKTANGTQVYEAYSSPIWFTRTDPSNGFSIGKLKQNRKNGTAVLFVSAPGPGKFTLGGAKVKAAKAAAPGVPAIGGRVRLVIRPKSKLFKVLKRKGKAKTAVKVRFTPTFGATRTKSKSLKLVRKVHKPRRHGKN